MKPRELNLKPIKKKSELMDDTEYLCKQEKGYYVLTWGEWNGKRIFMSETKYPSNCSYGDFDGIWILV